MKKIILIFICVWALLMLGACGSGGTSDGEGSGSSNNMLAGISAKDLNIEDFEWDVDEAKIEGYDCYALTLTNNSKYDVLGAQIQYEPKDDVTEEQLSVFEGFMEEHADYVDEDETIKDVMLRGDSKKYVKPGETVSDIPLAIGIGDYTWSDVPDEDQFKLMQPEELAVGIVDGDKLYLAYYDIPDSKWKIDAQTADLNKWPKAEIGKLVPKVKGNTFTSESYNNINSLDVEVYGVSKEDFDAYVSKVKEAGFTKDEFEDDNYYSADDEKGNSIIVDYNEYSDSFDITAYGADEDETEAEE